MPTDTETGHSSIGSRERTFLFQGSRDGMRLFLSTVSSLRPNGLSPVLYVHGATFPSALWVAYTFSGRSWRDALNDAGFDVWALDFYGFGGSDRYPQMDEPADAHGPLGLAADALGQIEAAVRFILEHSGAARLSLITHSWGSMPAGLFAANHPTLVDRIVMFAPLACREGPRYVPRPTAPAWKLVSIEDQWARFVEDVPPGEPPVLSRDDFAEWAQATRSPLIVTCHARAIGHHEIA